MLAYRGKYTGGVVGDSIGGLDISPKDGTLCDSGGAADGVLIAGSFSWRNKLTDKNRQQSRDGSSTILRGEMTRSGAPANRSRQFPLE